MKITEERFDAISSKADLNSYPYKFLKQDYLKEVAEFSVSEWDAPKRAARLGAAVKRYKTSVMIHCVVNIIGNEMKDKNYLDPTPMFVKKLCKSLFDRTGSQQIIVSVFGENGRKTRSNDNMDEVVEMLTAKHKKLAESYESQWNADIALAKDAYELAKAERGV